MRVLSVAFLCLLGTSLSPSLLFAYDVPAPSSQEAIQTIEVKSLQSLLRKKNAVAIFDVREKEEYDAGHIDGAKLVQLNSILNNLKEFPKGKKIVVYCRSGHRSAQAATILKEQGYANVVSLSGGFQEWTAYQEARKQEMRVCSTSSGCTK